MTTSPETSALPWADLVEAGYLTVGDCLIAARIARMCEEPCDSPAALALVLAIRSVREGSTALDLTRTAQVRPEHDEEPDEADAQDEALGSFTVLPDPQVWLDDVGRSVLVTRGVLRVDLGLVYLDRYYCDETAIAAQLLDRAETPPPPLSGSGAAAETSSAASLNDAQRAAVESVLTRSTTVLTGGPGMGKTHTIGGVLLAVRDLGGQNVRVALAAPTGKAAARMTESLLEQGVEVPEQSTTLHRLLGWKPGSSQRFRHDRHDPLPHDLVVVDEASMISLSMMARLLEALPSSTRLLLVGDPDQLASVEAGSVLRDIADGLDGTGAVVRLTQEYRLASQRAALARAFRRGDRDEVLSLLDAATAQNSDEVCFIETESPDATTLPGVLSHAARLREAALTGDREATTVLLSEARLLCAHRTGPYGTQRWNRLVEQALTERWPEISHQEMYVGRPLLVTRNDHALGLTNGDTGVIVREGDDLVAAFASDTTGLGDMSPWRLTDIETMHAMTVHKAQGSQADDVTVVVPPLGSRLLTREMLYTAVTRARRHLTIVGTREAVREAVATPANRSSGLGRRLTERLSSTSHDAPSPSTGPPPSTS